MPRFQKGNPGGPGRPRGSRNAVNLMLDQLAVEGSETVVRKMIEAASDGDRVAARMVLNRVWSQPKGRAVAIDLPEITTPADLLAAHAALASGIAGQTITPRDGAALSAMLDTHRRAFELVAQEDRVERLEAQVRALKARLT
jgi:hypothetical protein